MKALTLESLKYYKVELVETSNSIEAKATESSKAIYKKEEVDCKIKKIFIKIINEFGLKDKMRFYDENAYDINLFLNSLLNEILQNEQMLTMFYAEYQKIEEEDCEEEEEDCEDDILSAEEEEYRQRFIENCRAYEALILSEPDIF